MDEFSVIKLPDQSYAKTNAIYLKSVNNSYKFKYRSYGND